MCDMLKYIYIYITKARVYISRVYFHILYLAFLVFTYHLTTTHHIYFFTNNTN